MFQKTIKRCVELVGIGLHKGLPVHLRSEPLGCGKGIIFFREDIGVTIPLNVENVTSTTLATTISKDGFSIHTIEHLLASIYSFGIDNIEIVLDSEEVPIMDGSSAPFCLLLQEAGIRELDEEKSILVIREDIEVRDGDRFVRLSPNSDFVLDFTIEFKHPLIKKQSLFFDFSLMSFIKEISQARTFGFLQEVQFLRSKNLALGGSLQNAIVLDNSKILNSEGLRYKDEFVRHKILDAIGDLSIVGMPIRGKYTSFAGSHSLNHMLTKAIFEDCKNYEIVNSKSLSNEIKLQEAFAN